MAVMYLIYFILIFGNLVNIFSQILNFQSNSQSGSLINGLNDIINTNTNGNILASCTQIGCNLERCVNNGIINNIQRCPFGSKDNSRKCFQAANCALLNNVCVFTNINDINNCLRNYQLPTIG